MFIMRGLQKLFIFTATLPSYILHQCSAFSAEKVHRRQFSIMQSSSKDNCLPDFQNNNENQNRRQVIQMCSSFLVSIGATLMKPNEAVAKSDCMTDCLKNCKLIAPKVC